jgi:ribokinase
MHLLLIEDDLDLGGSLQQALAGAGITSEWLRSAAHAQATLDPVRHECVLLDLNLPDGHGLALLARWRAAGITTLLNPAPAATLKPELLAATDWLAPNETEFATIFGGEARGDGANARIKAAAAKSGAKLIVTLGSAGAVIAIPGEELISIPAPEAKVVDTTGAGDAFLGAFAFGLASGLDPVEAAKLSVACASKSVERLGTQSSYLSREDAAALAAPYLAKGGV